MMRRSMTQERRRLIAAVSPIPLIALCRVAQHLAGPALGAWAWLPTMLLFWAVIALLVLWAGGGASVARWLQPARGAWGWRLLALALGLLSLPAFLEHWHVLQPPALLLLWLAFSLLNPWFEEGYWRGLLLDATERWGGLLSVTYSAVLF